MVAQHSIERAWLQWPQPGCIADAFPIARERTARPFATIDRKPIGKYRRIHRSGAGRAEPLEAESLLFQKSVKYAPGKGAMRSAALERQVDSPHRLGRCRLVICRRWHRA